MPVRRLVSPCLTSLCLFVALCLPSAVRAQNGPSPTTWIPSGTDQTVGTADIRLQSGTLHARDVKKVFVEAVAGRELRIVVSGQAGEQVDYFDEIRDNGLYAIFGSVDPGTIDLKFQSRPSTGGSWVTDGTLPLTVANKRTLIYDTDFMIGTWYLATQNAGGFTSTTLASHLDNDFADLADRGFDLVTYIWNPVNHKTVIFDKLAEHGLKISINFPKTTSYINSALTNLSGHHDVPLLAVENKLAEDGILSDIGGGVAMKDSPQLWSYLVYDEPTLEKARGIELAAMMVKAVDPNHSANVTLARSDTYVNINAVKTPFVDVLTLDPYPLGKNVGTSDFGQSTPFSGYHLNFVDYLEWAKTYKPGQPLETIIQAFGNATFWRTPSPNELRAMAMMAMARDTQVLNYFIYQYTTGGEELRGLLNTDDTPTANLDEAEDINAKLAVWRPTYERLTADDNGTEIDYTTVPRDTKNSYFNDFEGGSSTYGATITTAKAFSGTHSGLLSDSSVRAQTISRDFARLPRYDSAIYSVYVNDNNASNMKYQLGAMIRRSDGAYIHQFTGQTAIGSGWQQLTQNLTGFASNPDYIELLKLEFRAWSTNGVYDDHWVDDVQLEVSTPPYTPNYERYGGVVGAFVHQETGERYLIVVNTDTQSSQTITVHAVGAGGAVPSVAYDVETGQSYNLTYAGSYGILNINIPAGDGRLLVLDPADPPDGGGGGNPPIILYANDFESGNNTFGSSLTTAHAHSPTHSGLMDGSNTIKTQYVQDPLSLPTGYDTATYSLYVNDQNDSAQMYRLGVFVRKAGGVYVQRWTGHVAVGADWGKVSLGLSDWAADPDYQELVKIHLRAYRSSGSYVDYHIDDVVVELTDSSSPPPSNPPVAFYENDQESSASFGATRTTAQANSPTHSTLIAGSNGDSVLTQFVNHDLTLSSGYSSVVYQMHINDQNHSSQQYRLGAFVRKSDGTYVQRWLGPTAVGANWGQVSLDLSSWAASPDYEYLVKVFLRAYNPGTYVDYYIDDVQVMMTQ